MTRFLITLEGKTAAVSNAHLNHSLLSLWNSFVNKITSMLQEPWLGDHGFVRVLLSPSTSLIKLNWNPKLVPKLGSGLSSMPVFQSRQPGICLAEVAWSTKCVHFPGGAEAASGGTRGWTSVCHCWEQRYTPVIIGALFLCSHGSVLGLIMGFFLLRCFFSLQLSPLSKLIVTVLEQACPLGQIAGKLTGDHEHFDVFAAVLPEKMTGFSPSLK